MTGHLTTFDAAKVDDWANRITACWRQSVESIIATGRLIAEAKAVLEHGEYLVLTQEHLPFGARTAQRLMAVAADVRLSNTTHASHLPPSWTALYEITRLDDETFEARIADGTIRPEMERKDISTVVKVAKRAEREKVMGGLILALPTKKYGVIVEDFEWDDKPWSRDTGMDRHAGNHYETAKDAHTPEEIVKRTKDRFECAAPDCFLAMWSTIQHLAIALDVMKLRGFTYVSHHVWGKEKIGLGRWIRENHDIFLMGVRGKIPCPAPGTQYKSFIIAPRGEHSAKPEVFLEMIEKYFPTLPKIELNRRGPARPGWDAWGNESETAAREPDSTPRPPLHLAPIEDDHTMPGIPDFLRRQPQAAENS